MKHQPSFFEQALDQTKASCNNTMDASAKLLSDGWNETGKQARQAGAVVDGLIVGGIKEIPNQVINHPKETAEKVALGVGAGLAIGLLPLAICRRAAGGPSVWSQC